MPMTYLDLIRCPSGRFDNFTQFTDAVNLETGYYCLKNPNITLEGSVAAKAQIITFINIAECNQTSLDRAGKNKTCVTDHDDLAHTLADL